MISSLLDQLGEASLVRKYGRVSSLIGTILEVKGVSGRIGEYFDVRVSDGHAIRAEVVGFRENRMLLMPFNQPRGIKPDDAVVTTGRLASIGFGSALLGRVIDPFGEPLDSAPPASISQQIPLYPPPANPMLKARVTQPIRTGNRAIDTFLGVGKGQRIGIFSGSGVGKSKLFMRLAIDVPGDVKVIALIGERGREVVDLAEALASEGVLGNCVIVAATSDQPALVRAHAIFSATAIAEAFAKAGKDVVLLADSITRHALAQREIGLSVGEPPTMRGFTPSVFSQLPMLIERAGAFKSGGTVTGIYTVLVEGGDLDEPVSDCMRSILDGHIVLSRDLADQGIFPAIDVLKSRSRIRDDVTSKAFRSAAGKLFNIMVAYERMKDFIEIGGYRKGENHEADKIVMQHQALLAWLAESGGSYRGDISESVSRFLKELAV